ncbi:MAG TPA: phosphate ABC transporter permease PstA [Actinomycetota bacterium]|jgi:phosphate transport system permease protein|nr:phosphate ABC transporter permease PstA [Actinomycetota bacterium]
MAITGITDATRAEVARSLTGKRRDIAETLFSLVLLLTLIIALAVLIVLLFNVARTAVPLLAHQGGRVLGNDYSSLPQNAGIRSGLIGSIYLMIFVILLAVPLGIGAAIYMEEYARDTRLARFINTNIRNLAGVPAIVYGILGFAVFAQLLGSVTGPKVAGLSLLTGGLTISLMVLPIVIITTQEALRSVPTSIREGGFGVGATRWEVIRSHVLPNAAPGILTGSVLAMARALGETAPLIMVGAVTGFLSTHGGPLASLRQKFTALPTLIFTYTKKPLPELQDLAAAAILVLILMIFFVNLTAILLRNRYERKW